MAAAQLGSLEGRGILVMGAGEMGEGMVRALASNGVTYIRIANRTFDNAAGLNNANISTLSTVGISGAFNSVQSLTASGTPTGVFDIGSPGRIAAPIPEPGTYALFAAGLAVIGSLVRRRLG
jgi:hypothetical protein